jgi:hypothetical protein
MPQCIATNRQGGQCRRQAIKGGTVCRYHGGASPQVKRAAEARAARMEAHAIAERMVARAGVDADPIEHLLESLHRAAALVEVWGQMVAALDAAAETEAAGRGTLRGELGYIHIDDPDSRDDLGVVSKDRLLTLNYRGESQVHPYVTEYQAALDRRAKFAKLCIDAGVAERQVRLAEQQGAMLAQAIRGILTELGVADRPEVPGVVRRHLTLVAGAA